MTTFGAPPRFQEAPSQIQKLLGFSPLYFEEAPFSVLFGGKVIFNYNFQTCPVYAKTTMLFIAWVRGVYRYLYDIFFLQNPNTINDVIHTYTEKPCYECFVP